MSQDILTTTFLRLRGRLLASARRLLADDSAAEDALQEAFFKLWERRRSIESRAEAEGLTVVAVRNSCIDQLRRSSRRAECPIDPTAEAVAETDPESDRAELYESVRAIINGQLNERERQVITMRDTQGYSFAEIAGELKITETNARMILSRARKTVREIYLSSKK